MTISADNITNITVVIVTTIIAPLVLRYSKERSQMRRQREKECAKAIKSLAELNDEVRRLKFELERRETHFDMKDRILKRMCDEFHKTGHVTPFDIEAVEGMIATRPERWRDIKVEIGHG